MKKHTSKTADPAEYDYLSAASSNDCTGLIPNLPLTAAAIENYEELYPFLTIAPIDARKDEEVR